MPIAPSGAVIRMATTATERTICPHESPIAIGTEPIAACTVALGRYAITQKILSLIFSFVPTRQSHTQTERKMSAKNIIPTAAIPAFIV